jgi:hypothetical protein
VENLKIRIVAIKREKDMVTEGGREGRRRGSVMGRESEGERVVDRIGEKPERCAHIVMT